MLGRIIFTVFIVSASAVLHHFMNADVIGGEKILVIGLLMGGGLCLVFACLVYALTGSLKSLPRNDDAKIYQEKSNWYAAFLVCIFSGVLIASSWNSAKTLSPFRMEVWSVDVNGPLERSPIEFIALLSRRNYQSNSLRELWLIHNNERVRFRYQASDSSALASLKPGDNVTVHLVMGGLGFFRVRSVGDTHAG